MPYCTTADLLLDPQFGLPNGISKTQYVQFGADRIDAAIGRVYKTPVVFDTTAEQAKYSATIQLLKVVNQHLSSGMLINAISLSGEEAQANAYGTYLIAQAQQVLDAIVAGDVFLEGAEENPSKDDESDNTKPRVAIYNIDAESATEAFYGMVWSPNAGLPPFQRQNLFGDRG